MPYVMMDDDGHLDRKSQRVGKSGSIDWMVDVEKKNNEETISSGISYSASTTLFMTRFFFFTKHREKKLKFKDQTIE